MTTTELVPPPQFGEQAPDDELRDALIREARQRARRRRSMYVGAVVVTAVAGIAAWSAASPGNTPPPATLDGRLPPAQAGPRTSAAAAPTTAPPPVVQSLHWTYAPLYLRDVETGEKRPLSVGLVEGFSLAGTYVPSPDGTRVLVSDICYGPPNPCPRGSRMAVANIDGTDARAITPPDGRRPATPSWSSDSTKIVYAGLDDSSRDFAEIFIEDLTTEASTQITHLGNVPRGSSLMPKFTPDGRGVLFMLPKGPYPYSDVWSVPVTGGGSTLVIEDAEFPTPLPDGTIAFVRNTWRGVWVTSIGDPGSERPLIPPYEVVNRLVAASPDGTRLIYFREATKVVVGGGGFGGLPPVPDDDRGGTYIVDVATGAVKKVPLGASGWLDNHTLIYG